MTMWWRLGGALLVTLAVIALLEYFGVSSLLSGRAAEESSRETHNRAQEIFWFLIFTVVMATSVLAAVRRWSGHLRRAVAPPAGARRALD